MQHVLWPRLSIYNYDSELSPIRMWVVPLCFRFIITLSTSLESATDCFIVAGQQLSWYHGLVTREPRGPGAAYA